MIDYTTATAIAESLDLQTPDDSTLTLVLTAASRLVDSWCGRTFSPQPTSIIDDAAEARYFNPNDGYCCLIDDCRQIYTVSTDDAADAMWSTAWSASSYAALPLDGIGPNAQTGWPFTSIITLGVRTFSRPFSRLPYIKISGWWGWESIPKDVELATQMVAEEMYKAVREAPFGSAGLTDFGPVFIRGNKRFQDLLQPYRKLSASDGKYLVA